MPRRRLSLVRAWFCIALVCLFVAAGSSRAPVTDALASQTPSGAVSRYVGSHPVAWHPGESAASPAAQSAQALEAAWLRAQAAGNYRFDADITQVLEPRAVPEMVGRREATLSFTLDGAVQLPERAYLEMRAAANGRATPAVVLLREEGRTYTLQDGVLTLTQDPTGVPLVEADMLGYLGAAENVRALEDVSVGGQTLTRLAFDISGPRLAERARDHAQEALRARPGAPEGATVSLSPVLQRLSGQGELWLDADGLPVRQILDLRVPAMSEIYDARLHMAVDLRDFGQVQALPRAVQGADGVYRLEGIVSVGQQVAALGGASVTPPTAASTFVWQISPVAVALFLLVFAVLVLLRFYRRDPRRAYAYIAIVMVILLVTLPLLQTGSLIRFIEREAQAAAAQAASGNQMLQALGLAPQTVAKRPAPELDLTLKETAPQPARGRVSAAASLQQEVSAPSDYIEGCGQGSPTADTDGDGLSDQAEGCLGTDPYEADTDKDGLPDGLEVLGFDHGGKHWVLNPKDTDSNRDGLSDYEELSTALGGLSALLDTDSDGIPDVWDDDNDDDGVPDYVDLSAQAVSPYATGQSLSIQGGTFDGYQYIEYQVQPQNAAHLRYTTTALDWPDDDQGNVQDLDNSTEDIRLTPFMLVTANVVPSELTSEYGLRVWQHEGKTIMLVPLQPVVEGGHTMAFYGKVAYAPDMAGRIEHLQWDMEMVWMVQATVDSMVAGKVSPSTTVLNQFKETFRFSGLRISRSRGYEVGVMGTPSTPVEDRDLFTLRQGLAAVFLDYQELEFQTPGQTALGQLEARLANPATPITYTWGVTGSLVSMVSHVYGHRDEGLAGVGNSLTQDLLDAHYGYDLSDPSKLCRAVDDDGNSYYFKGTSLLLATEEEAGMLDLSDMNAAVAGQVSASLANVPIYTLRSVKLVMYEQLESSLWQMMTPSRMMQVVELRYRDQFDEFSIPDCPNLLPEDFRFITYLAYVSANIGATVVMSEDGLPVTGITPDEQRIGDVFLGIGNAAWSQVGYYVPAYISIVTGLSDSLNKLRGMDWWGRLTNQKAPGFVDEFSHLSPDIFTEAVRPTRLQTASKVVGYVNIALGAVVGAATLIMNTLQLVCGSGEDFACGNEKAFKIAGDVINVACVAVQAVGIASMALQMATKSLDAFKGVAAGLAVVGTVIGIGMAWVTFGLAIAGSDSPVVIKAAVALVIVTTIWLIFLLVINVIPVVGQIISAILCLIDTLISLLTGFLCEEGWSVSRILVELFYSVEELTTLGADPGPSWYDWTTGLRDASTGLVAGNALEVSASFAGNMVKTNGSNDDLGRSWVRGDLHGGPGSSFPAIQANSGTICTIVGDKRYCTNVPKLIFSLPTARINHKVQFEAVTTFQYVYAEYGLYGAFRWNTIADEVRIPDDDEDPEYNDIVLDVQPTTLDGWWTWNALTNPDRDGDGLTDAQEAALGTNPTTWDTDGDGLSDKFEDERRGDGFDPLMADSDMDGLNDLIEFRLNTKPNSPDTDQDGLLDGQEVYHRKEFSWDPCPGAIGDWVGGWQARLINGATYWVTSNPLLALTDADPLSDLAEKQNAFSPWARNTSPALILGVSPMDRAQAESIPDKGQPANRRELYRVQPTYHASAHDPSTLVDQGQGDS